MPPQVKFEIIRNTIECDNNVLSISRLCEIAGVSRSGYYAWVNAAPKRAEREEHDKEDFDKILEAYKYRGYAKGARSIYMHLLHKRTIMNLKKIRRLMKKYGLKCPYRQPAILATKLTTGTNDRMNSFLELLKCTLCQVQF